MNVEIKFTILPLCNMYDKSEMGKNATFFFEFYHKSAVYNSISYEEQRVVSCSLVLSQDIVHHHYGGVKYL